MIRLKLQVVALFAHEKHRRGLSSLAPKDYITREKKQEEEGAAKLTRRETIGGEKSLA